LSAEVLPATLLSRKAIVYVRQSTQTQVQTNLESKRRQYDLVEAARHHGFASVEVIDDDLGRSASGSMARPGFDRLVATVCAGEVGAVLCLDASRLARNGRDWHHLLELCGLVGARVIDTDGIYDPCRPNDRLLLGMKGSISEFELGVIRSRMHDAKHGKALRGDLRISVPIGYIWHREIGLGLDPSLRVQEAVRVVFMRFRQLGSARQALLSLAAEQMLLALAVYIEMISSRGSKAGSGRRAGFSGSSFGAGRTSRGLAARLASRSSIDSCICNRSRSSCSEERPYFMRLR
jgi:DNA invertase Pin-like site-specific DNA recombinase